MSRNQKLSDSEVAQQLEQFPDWTINDGKLCRRFTFSNFVEAFGFMSKVALLAERANHHPEWSNCYKVVDIALTTHEFGGISQRDFSLIREVEALQG